MKRDVTARDISRGRVRPVSKVALNTGPGDSDVHPGQGKQRDQQGRPSPYASSQARGGAAPAKHETATVTAPGRMHNSRYVRLFHEEGLMQEFIHSEVCFP